MKKVFIIIITLNFILLFSCSTSKIGWENTHTIKGHASMINSVDISSDSKKIISGSHDGSAKLWEYNGKEWINTHSFKGNNGSVSKVAINPDGTMIVTADGYETLSVKVWEYNNDTWINSNTSEFEHTNLFGDIVLLSIFFHFTQNSIIAATVTSNSHSEINLWKYDGEEWSYIHPLRGHLEIVKEIHFSKDKDRIMTISNSQIKLWELNGEEWEIIHTATYPHESILTGNINNDGNRYAVVNNNHIEIVDYDGKEWKCFQSIDINKINDNGFYYNHRWNDKSYMTFTLTESNIIYVIESYIKLWQYNREKWIEIPHLEGHTAEINTISSNSDGSIIVSGGGFTDESIKIWEKNF